MVDIFQITVLTLHRHSTDFLVGLHDFISDLKQQFQRKVRFADGKHSLVDSEFPFNHFFNGIVCRVLILINLLNSALQLAAETLIPGFFQYWGWRRRCALVYNEFIHGSILIIDAEAFWPGVYLSADLKRFVNHGFGV